MISLSIAHFFTAKFQFHGFLYSEDLTKVARAEAAIGEMENPGHLMDTLMVFINPKVASLPQHAHLVGGHGGCYATTDNLNGGSPCTGQNRASVAFLYGLELQV